MRVKFNFFSKILKNLFKYNFDHKFACENLQKHELGSKNESSPGNKPELWKILSDTRIQADPAIARSLTRITRASHACKKPDPKRKKKK